MSRRWFTFSRKTPGMTKTKMKVNGKFKEKTGTYILDRHQINTLNRNIIFCFKPEDIEVTDEFGDIYPWKFKGYNCITINIL